MRYFEGLLILLSQIENDVAYREIVKKIYALLTADRFAIIRDMMKKASVEDVKEVYVKDDEWFTEYIKVQGKKVTIKINGKTVVDYTEPDKAAEEQRKISNGTFALQGHDPKSEVHFKNILVKVMD